MTRRNGPRRISRARRLPGVRELYPGAQRHVPEVRDVRVNDGVFVRGVLQEMGEARRKSLGTKELLARYPFCCFCGGTVHANTGDHYPPKALFNRSDPKILVVPACKPCNDLSRTADLVTAIVARWSFSELERAEAADHKKLTRRLKYQAPGIVDEWLEMSSGTQQKRARRHLQNEGISVPYEGNLVSIGPQTIPQLNLFAHKLTLAMYFDETRQSLPVNGLVSANMFTKEDVEVYGIPYELKKYLGDSKSLSQGDWDTRLQFEFRTAMSDDCNAFQVLARLR